MARFKHTDVSNAEQVQALVDFAVAEFGGLTHHVQQRRHVRRDV